MYKDLTADPCIPYGRGGAGNMRRRSSIASAWSKLATQPSDNKISPCSSPNDYYANLKTERRMSASTHRRRASSMWSLSTVGEKRSIWSRLFRRRDVVGEEHEKEKGVEDFE